MNKTVLAHLAAAVAALSAGTAVVATRFVIGETDPISLAFYRYLIGSLCFLPLLPFIWPKERVSASEFGKIAVLGLLFFCLFTWGFNAALEVIPAARGAVGLATVPIQTLIVAAIFGREAMTARKIASVAIAFAGIAIVFGPAAMNVSPDGTLFGDAAMLLGVFCAALYSVFSRASLMKHGPLFVTAIAMMFGALALLVLSLVTTGVPGVPGFSTKGWIAVVFLGTFAGAIQFALFTWALRWLPPSMPVLYISLNPIMAMVLGVLLIGETVTWPLVFGLALVLTAILLGSGVLSNLLKRIGAAKADGC
ncbi:MAG: DMT family transporter [Pseudomonadota bacterium]